MSENDTETRAADRSEQIAAGRIKHGVGPSEDFPGNVCHLVSPIVGMLRLRQRDGSDLPDIGWIINRLSLVLDMAEAEAAAGVLATPAPARPQVTHMPRCNTECGPGAHHLTGGIGMPHLHRTDLARECGGCAQPSGPPLAPPAPEAEFHCGLCGSDTHSALACDPTPVLALTGTATTVSGWCPRCGQPVATWHTKPECDANYDAAYRAAAQSTPAPDYHLAVCQNKECLEGVVHGHNDGGWMVLPRPEVAKALAKAWDEGVRTGTSRAMRKMSDEPDLPLASPADNPYHSEVKT